MPDNILEKFRDEIQELIKKPEYSNIMYVTVASLISGDADILMFGTMCPVCCLEDLEDFIDENNIKHHPQDYVGKVN